MKSAFSRTALGLCLATGLAVASSPALAQSSDDAAVQEYRTTIDRLLELREYNAVKNAIIANQAARIAAIETETAAIEAWKADLPNVVEEMISGLETFVADDVPFRKTERANRLDALRSSLNGAAEDDSDEKKFVAKFFKTMEAVQIENDYGRSIESYTDMLVEGETETEAYFLMVGRVALYYHTVEGTRAGMWDNQSKSWITDLPSGATDQIRTAIAVAREEVPPDLLLIPLPAPTDS